MHLGLVGGIGPAATDYYYRGLIEACAARDVPLELTIAHADAPTLLRHLESDDKAAQVAIYLKLAGRLKAAGAGVVAITSIAGHFCIDEFAAVSPLPIVNMLQETNAAIKSLGLEKVGILGTRTVMESKFYGGIGSAAVVPPSGNDLTDVHEAYIAIAMSGKTTDAQREVFHAAGRRLVADHGVDAVMLGGTDLVLAFDGDDHGFDVIDCAGIHIDALARIAADRQSA